ncbi:DNA polymerase [Candidatus Acidianus copahuensis]|uniref:DNA polymerase sliding clamp n=1 Tax=Candidatus Acidianus copahuensis TaxID=1160895 RepID=A0A031LLM3_9CREN|nr:proliferating cell nuclear antigen (pcna) [Candidatus Acidianus copahuensis]EZQ03107.1 DNA polymerase [Candidatus Acidianus copahuensis]
MRAVYEDSSHIKSILIALARLVDEASIKFGKEGIELVAMDRAHISLIKLKIPKEGFKEYEIEEEINFGFNTQFLMKVISSARRNETIEFSAEDPSIVFIRIVGSIMKEFKINNIDISQPDIPELNLQFDVNALVNSSAFKKAVDQISSVSDEIDFSADENGIKLSTKSETNVEVELTKDMGAVSELELTKPTSSTYSSEYLSDILVLTNLSGNTRLFFGEQKPLQLQFDMENGGNVVYLLAPQMG